MKQLIYETTKVAQTFANIVFNVDNSTGYTMIGKGKKLEVGELEHVILMALQTMSLAQKCYSVHYLVVS